MTPFTLLFLALKLTGYISWPWLLVLLPSIIDFSLVSLYVGFWYYTFGKNIWVSGFRTNGRFRRK